MQFKSSEILILLAASVMSLAANLPDDMLGTMIDRNILLAALIGLVVVALFRYLQVYLLLLISILAIGANLPAEMASRLGISQTVLLVSLCALIAIALINRVVKLVPTEPGNSSTALEELQHEMMAAIARGDQLAVHRMLVMGTSANFIIDGTTPLHLAAEKGYPELVRLLISYGADYRKTNAEGLTALEIAQGKNKFFQTEDILIGASKSKNAAFAQSETQRIDAEIWNKQHR